MLQGADHVLHGMQVFVTCGTADKRAFLLEAFPTLREDHIGDSRSCSFEKTVKRQTAGKGVHLALNSLADDKLQVKFLFLPSKFLCPGTFNPRTCVQRFCLMGNVSVTWQKR